MKKQLYLGSFFALSIMIFGCDNIENNQRSVEYENTDSLVNVVEEELSTAATKLPSEFVDEDYFIFEKFSGDLNKDGIIDSVFLVKKINQENIVVDEYLGELDRNRRGIMIFFNVNDQWELKIKNMDCFSSENEDGGVYFPPELSLEVKKDNLYIAYSHGRYGSWQYTFRFKESDFELIGYDSSDNYGPIINSETSINYLTKKKLVRVNVNENTAQSGEEIFEEQWEDIQIKHLIKLSEIEDFDLLNLD